MGSEWGFSGVSRNVESTYQNLGIQRHNNDWNEIWRYFFERETSISLVTSPGIVSELVVMRIGSRLSFRRHFIILKKRIFIQLLLLSLKSRKFSIIHNLWVHLHED